MTLLHAQTRTIASLRASERARMFSLMTRVYDGVSESVFYADLDDKDVVVTAVCGDGQLQGFTTVRFFDHAQGTIAYSGDTVIAPEFWGEKVLQKGFSRLMLRRMAGHPTKRLYWLLLSKGYKTYLLMYNHFPRMIPRPDSVHDPKLADMRDAVASSWWGTQYDDKTHILRWATARDHVRQGLATVDDELLQNPAVAFFVAQNPGYQKGDELVCLCQMRVRDLLRGFALASLRRFKKRLIRMEQPC